MRKPPRRVDAVEIRRRGDRLRSRWRVWAALALVTSAAAVAALVYVAAHT